MQLTVLTFAFLADMNSRRNSDGIFCMRRWIVWAALVKFRALCSGQQPDRDDCLTAMWQRLAKFISPYLLQLLLGRGTEVLAAIERCEAG